MTCREKLKLEHPENIDPDCDGGCRNCPHTYGYLPLNTRVCESMSCYDCWDREIPGTEIKKENDIMPISAAKASKMTKAQMLEEIERANATIHEMEQELKNLEKYKQYEEAADEIRAIHISLVNSGFSDDQAFELLKTAMQAMAPTVMRGMRV